MNEESLEDSLGGEWFTERPKIKLPCSNRQYEYTATKEPRVFMMYKPNGLSYGNSSWFYENKNSHEEKDSVDVEIAIN